MKTPLSFSIPLAYKTLNEIRDMTFVEYASYRKKLSNEIAISLNFKLPDKPISYATLKIVRHSPRLVDTDGLYGGAKPLIDCLCQSGPRHPNGLGFIEDDNPLAIKQEINPWIIKNKSPPQTVITIIPWSEKDPEFIDYLSSINANLEDIYRQRSLKKPKNKKQSQSKQIKIPSKKGSRDEQLIQSLIKQGRAKII